MKDSYHNYETISVDSLSAYRAEGLHLRHRKTGAEVYRINAEDNENLFAFTFRTPPPNHTGVSHILEHAVLCGSQRYPLKDPFLELLKGSAHTFLNAMTYPDKTIYPAAATIKADFLNLLRVYGDAVFFPCLKREAFEQEGHRLEFDDSGNLVRSGIVLNEMKGSYSSTENLIMDWNFRTMFPDTAYRWDSGGDPAYIPQLSYEAFKAFHASFYHPSNARIFLYGNHNTEEVLDILDTEFLSRFSRKEPAGAPELQPRWNKPRRQTAYRPCAPGESTAGKTTISLNWLWGDMSDPFQAVEARVMAYILLGHSGSPLQKALIDSGLGEDISPVSGLESSLRQIMFTAALRGTEADREDRLLDVVNSTLEKAAGGLDADLVEGALRTIEFRLREIRGGSPYGLQLLKRALQGWLHGGPPSVSLNFQEPMNKLREGSGKGHFEHFIRKNMLENPHRGTVILLPEPGLLERRDQEERQQLSALQERLTASEAEEIKRAGERLKVFQEAVPSPEELACIPFITPGDIPREVDKIAMDEGRTGNFKWYSHETLTNGVSYLEMAFDLSGLEPELQPWMPLFSHALTEVGLPGTSYSEAARLLSLKTGRLDCTLEAVSPLNGDKECLRLFVHLKALSSQWDEAMDITLKLLNSADFSDMKRIDDLLMEVRNEYQSVIIPSGSAFAALRASARHSRASAWEELWYGIEQLKFLQAVSRKKNRAELASEALNTIRQRIIQQHSLAIALASDSNSSVRDKTLAALTSLPEGTAQSVSVPPLFRHETLGESIVIASAVSFSGLSLPGTIHDAPLFAHTALLSHLLNTGYLWESIRMKGGAYGAHSSVSRLEGTFTFSTYRDPLISPSLAAFRDSLEWAKSLSSDMVKLAVIGSAGSDLKPLSPSQKALTGLKRKLYGISDSMRQIHRDSKLTAGPSDIRKAAQKLINVWPQRSISVIAGEESLKAAYTENPELAQSRVRITL
ncbi:MAG: hypothetical protein B0D92_08690 [Spirochaeta sp. LUC14_002_19_P3]|nr:MAG: hypothetical protein B0D92_08690 [Spirochaeta sp. LUC14_002_19_P3]